MDRKKLSRILLELKPIFNKIINDIPYVENNEHDTYQIQESTVLLLRRFTAQNGNMLNLTWNESQTRLKRTIFSSQFRDILKTFLRTKDGDNFLFFLALGIRYGEHFQLFFTMKQDLALYVFGWELTDQLIFANESQGCSFGFDSEGILLFSFIGFLQICV